jgi:capsular polysaccharide transport system permease protein
MFTVYYIFWIIRMNPTNDTNALKTTLLVWKALFLRESVARISTGRAAWIWLLLEPVIHIGIIMFIFTVIRVRVVSGMDFAIWIMIGLLAFFMFMRTATQTRNAVSSNKALFAYRQVKPVDTVLSRAALEGLIMLIVFLTLFSMTYLIGIGIIPTDLLMTLTAFLGLWLSGLGFGLITSAIGGLIPELAKVISLIMAPIYFLSGVIFPVSSVPEPYVTWLVHNPIAHGLEAARLSMSDYYHPFQDLSLGYLYFCAITMIFIGLALHRRYATRLVMA